ncbi:methyltransferase domain-containing protein [Pseudohoeflea coraliihabitans]|uniref:Class I SAM-dependent methyltransferase n=1 Tax=Pseudohoeflea coraliihabitans TaxID=2860393 RepID=A0ABS6WLW6_9HYPH|nr:methyltransferase domain-containing protein [Pseudohoeflea sp. DP4N28-3]MBW3096895.1 class I SAM-dependent methyltransferase [Pseudohoeflea sp. DP4N28-3]
MLERVILHTGTEKTGTTALQSALSDQRAELAAQGVLVPTCLDYGGPHLRLTVACLQFNPRAPLIASFGFEDADQHRQFQRELQKDISVEVSASAADTAIISDEHINVHLNSAPMLRNTAKFLGVDPGRVHPVIFLRSQDSLLAAMMSESVKSLSIRHYSLDDPVAALKVTRYRFDYAAIINNLEEAFGVSNLIVRGYKAPSDVDVTQVFAQSVDINLRTPPSNLVSANRSVPAGLMPPLWRLGQEVAEQAGSQLRSEWRGLIDRLITDFPSRSFRLKETDALSFLRRFQATNESLVAKFPQLEDCFFSRAPNNSDPQDVLEVGIEQIIESAEQHLSKDAFVQLVAIGNDVVPRTSLGVAMPGQGEKTPRVESEPTVPTTCPVCAICYELDGEAARREGPQCPNCKASGRASALLWAIARTVYGEDRPIKLQPARKDIRIIGLSDGPVYRDLLASRFDYTNTFYHQEPFLDIMEPAEVYDGIADILISSEVFEHVIGDYSAAFRGAHKILKPGAKLILTVPYQNVGEHREHYENCTGYSSFQDDKGRWLAEIEYADGTKSVDHQPRFHGGLGKILKMRLFSRDSLQSALREAGFVDITFHDRNMPEHGIVWGKPSRLVTALRPRDQAADRAPQRRESAPRKADTLLGKEFAPTVDLMKLAEAEGADLLADPENAQTIADAICATFSTAKGPLEIAHKDEIAAISHRRSCVPKSSRPVPRANWTGNGDDVRPAERDLLLEPDAIGAIVEAIGNA